MLTEVGKLINSSGVGLTLHVGLVVGQLAASDASTSTLGAQTAVGLLWEAVTIPAGGTISATYIAHDAEASAAAIAAATTPLR